MEAGFAGMESRNESARVAITEESRSSVGREHEEEVRCCGVVAS